MTYWPIASPSVFAATKHTHPERLQTSHDGIEPQSSDLPHGATADDSTQSSIADSEEQTEGDESSTQSEPELGAKGAVEQRPKQSYSTQSLPEDDIAGEILAIRVTRSAHMFATITQTTLTIWQTKACLSAANCP